MEAPQRLAQVSSHVMSGRTSVGPRQNAFGTPEQRHDVLIRGGRVVDPANDLDAVMDVAVRWGKVSAVAEQIDPSTASTVFDATGLVVCPGLIDTHVHVFTACTTLGIPPDEYCLGRGCTTVVDAGSAGAATLPAFSEFIVDQSQTRVRALPLPHTCPHPTPLSLIVAQVRALCHIASAGLANGVFMEPQERRAKGSDWGRPSGELDSMAYLSEVDAAAAAIEQHKSFVCGVKIRLGSSLADNGVNEAAAYERARALAAAVDMPLM